MKTAILTDTNSGITVEEGKTLGIFVLSMPTIIDYETYFEGVNLTKKEFFDAMLAGRYISTSQPSPGEVMDMCDEILGSGYEELIYIPMSSGLSNSCHSAIALAEDYDGKVVVADNHRISVTLRMAVLDAFAWEKQGCTAQQIKEKLEETAYESSIYLAVNTLEYLKKSGRVTPAGAAIGSILNIKPILTIQGGKLDAYAKVRGIKKCEAKIKEAIEKDRQERFGEVEDKNLCIGTAGTFLKEEDAKHWKEYIQEMFPTIQVYYDPLPCSIASHVGPDAVGIGISIVHHSSQEG